MYVCICSSISSRLIHGTFNATSSRHCWNDSDEQIYVINAKYFRCIVLIIMIVYYINVAQSVGYMQYRVFK